MKKLIYTFLLLGAVSLTASVATEVLNTAPTLVSITLESNATTLNVADKATLTLTATYSDNSTKVLDENITYVVTPKQNAEVYGSMLIALKDGNATVQATVDGVQSNTLHLSITWVVNGHTLPPEPDKTLNDSTLLGIDTNDNGVRDDVERYILQTYGKEEITIEIGFQVARAFNTVIEHPENAWETYKIIDMARDCETYFRNYADMFGDPILIKKRISSSKIFKSIQLNTEARIRGYLLHDQMLSGGVFTLREINTLKAACTFDVDVLLKSRK
jgi:hypothetical protein